MAKAHVQGFILVLTTMIIATSVLLISLVVNRVNAYRHLSQLWVDVEKARAVALGGIQIAMGQVARLDANAEKQEEKAPGKGEGQDPHATQEKEKKLKDQEEKEKAAVQVLLNAFNQWQTFTLKEKEEGLDGECSIYISSEEGKINLNKLYDFKEKKFAAMSSVNGKQICQMLTEGLKVFFERNQLKPINFEKVLEDFFKKHPFPLDDVSELLAIPEVARMQDQLFIGPETLDKLFFSDLFTVSTDSFTINPLLFSRAMSRVVGTRILNAQTVETPPLKELVTLMKAPKIDWQASWTPLLANLLGKEYRAVPEPVKPLFATRFEATVFSVVSYGKVGSVVQKVCAIIEKSKNARDKSQPFLLKKLYWL